jgi:hypothetical protein
LLLIVLFEGIAVVFRFRAVLRVVGQCNIVHNGCRLDDENVSFCKCDAKSGFCVLSHTHDLVA